MASRVEVMVRLTAHAEQVCRDLTVNAHANLVEATPVDTGWARALWLLSIGSPNLVTVTDGSPPGADPGMAAILAYKIADGAVFLSNGAPYIERLNRGSSDQAPAGFVEYAISQAILDGGNGRIVA